MFVTLDFIKTAHFRFITMRCVHVLFIHFCNNMIITDTTYILVLIPTLQEVVKDLSEMHTQKKLHLQCHISLLV